MECRCRPTGDAPHREGRLLAPGRRPAGAQSLRLTDAAGFGPRVFASPSSRQGARAFTPHPSVRLRPPRVLAWPGDPAHTSGSGISPPPSSASSQSASAAFFLIRGLCLSASRYCEEPGDLRVLVLRAERLSVFLSCDFSSEACAPLAWISR